MQLPLPRLAEHLPGDVHGQIFLGRLLAGSALQACLVRCQQLHKAVS